MSYDAGDTVTIEKYGGRYPAYIVRLTPTRALVNFVTKGGKAKQLWIQRDLIIRRHP